MDLAIYITELLGFKGVVNVPGLGYFEQRRISGYYNVGENKFYPPRHEVSFTPQPGDDDNLADFISAKKKISQASAKYFIDKYVSGIKQQASTDKAHITGLGYLRYEASQLVFEVDINNNVDPAFYGFAPVEAAPVTENARLQEDTPSPVTETPEATPKEEEIEITPEEEEEALTEDVAVPELAEEPQIAEPADEVPPTVIQPEESEEEPQEEQEYIYEEEEQTSSRSNLKVIGLVVIIIALLALTGLYLYQPELFGKKKPVTTIIVKPMSSKPAGLKDTVDEAEDSVAQAKADTQKQVAITPRPVQLPVDTAAVLHYEILGGAFPSLAKANEVITRYEKAGLHPRILKHVPGNLYKITLGTFFNGEKAAAAKDSILKATRIRPSDIYLQPYIPKKK